MYNVVKKGKEQVVKNVDSKDPQSSNNFKLVHTSGKIESINPDVKDDTFGITAKKCIKLRRVVEQMKK